MKLKIYSLYDLKAQIYSHPYYSLNDSVALRTFLQMGQDPTSTVHHYPDDFKLYRIGDFDDATGVLTPEHPFEILRPHKENAE